MAQLSVIIPAYNAEKNISDCLDSLLNQTQTQMEIIVVDDCSTDNTRTIVNNYIKANKQLKLIAMPQNLGPGCARNEGLQHVTGEYVGFVDSDDWIDLSFYSTLLHAIQEQDCDIAIAGIRDERNNILSSSLRYNYDDYAVINGKIALKLLTKSSNFGAFITPIMNNKLYKTSFIKKYNLHCCSNRSWQDDFFSFFAILHASKICLVPKVYYHYFQNNGSITHSGTNAITKIDNCLDVLCQIREELHAENIYAKYKQEYAAFVERCISSLLSMLRKENTAFNDELIYMFEKFSEQFSLKEIITYLDNERIYNFFHV